jgi:DNA anti-recombination protein RmuC
LDGGSVRAKRLEKETPMSSTNESPPGGFPKTIHGYNVGAVDDYFRKINTRVESLLLQVQSECSRADQSKRLLEQMTAELETMRRRASDAEKREITALDGQKQAQEEIAKLSQELKEAREKSRVELDAALADARQERDTLLAEERQDAEALVEEARKSAAAKVEETQRVVEMLQAEVARLTAEAGSPRADGAGHSASESSGIPGTSELTAQASANLEALSADARRQIDLVVRDIRKYAEQASERSIAVFQEQEKRVRALGDECEALAARLKEAVETQIVQLPAVSSRPPVGAGRSQQSNEEPAEKRVRDKNDWRRGDWRNAS